MQLRRHPGCSRDSIRDATENDGLDAAGALTSSREAGARRRARFALAAGDAGGGGRDQDHLAEIRVDGVGDDEPVDDSLIGSDGANLALVILTERDARRAGIGGRGAERAAHWPWIPDKPAAFRDDGVISVAAT